MKKIVAILLVVALMSALFVVPVHAHEDDVAPCGVVLNCPECNGSLQEASRDAYSKSVTVSYCDYETSSHYHTRYYNKVTYYFCSTCGYSTATSGYWRTYCPYRGYFVE